MKAAVLYEVKKPVEVQSVELPEPGPGEVMVKIMASGVCHSDWHVVKGDWDIVPLPSILGHEGAGDCRGRRPQRARSEPGRPRGAFVEDELRPLRELRERLSESL